MKAEFQVAGVWYSAPFEEKNVLTNTTGITVPKGTAIYISYELDEPLTPIDPCEPSSDS